MLQFLKRFFNKPAPSTTVETPSAPYKVPEPVAPIPLVVESTAVETVAEATTSKPVPAKKAPRKPRAVK